MWRASGTTANSSILKPGGSLIFSRFLRIAAAFLRHHRQVQVGRRDLELLHLLDGLGLHAGNRQHGSQGDASHEKQRTVLHV
jgi:hypothetical protein